MIETAVLAAFLVLQLRELAALAAALDRPDDARRWRGTAGTVRAAMLRDLWHDGRFVSRSPSSGRRRTSSSLLDLMPIVLGDDLPPGVGAEPATWLAGHLTGHGLATEPPGSPEYTADGYWRGPIWAPSTVFLEDGLRRAGHIDLADTVSRRFRAQSGAGLHDRAYTWTASAYLILAGAHRRRTT